MKATLHKFKSGAPQRDLYTKGEDFEGFEIEVNCAEAKGLLRHLILHRDSVYFDVEDESSVYVSIASDGILCVEITSAALWATSDVDIDIAEQIIEHACEGKDFTKHIPTTDREWDAYAFLGIPINNDETT